MDKVKILGVKIDNITKQETLNKIKDFLRSDRGYHIVTVNPEFLVKAKKDEEFYQILNRADLSIADGFGIVLMSRLIPPRIKNHIRGSDLATEILKIAETNKHKVCILNWEQSLSKKEEIAAVLKNKFPNLKFLIQDVRRDFKDIKIDEINEFRPQIIFATLGAPYQEKLIYKNLKKIPSLRLAIGVGGTFDFLTGKIKRAPKIMRKLELEWLWRLIKEPKLRFGRILTATVIFPYIFLKEKLIHPFLYRPNVACLMYKKDSGGIKIFLAEREDEAGHFQIPQGGTDGENIKEAGLRELKEEIGADNFEIKKAFKNVRKYKFTGRRNGYKYCNYKGQKQGLLIVEFKGSDDEIKIFPYDYRGWKWVDVDNVLNEIHPCRREGMKKFLEKMEEIKSIL